MTTMWSMISSFVDMGYTYVYQPRATEPIGKWWLVFLSDRGLIEDNELKLWQY